MLRIQNLRMQLDYTEADLRRAVSRKLHIPEKQIKSVKLRKRSVDARKKNDITFLLTVDVKADGEQRILKAADKDVQAVTEKAYRVPIVRSEERPVVVGFGPGGMFAAFVLAKAVIRVALQIKMPFDFLKVNGKLLGVSFFQIGVSVKAIPQYVALRAVGIDVLGVGQIETAVVVFGIVDAVFAGAAVVAGDAFFCDMHSSFLFGFRGPFQFS